MIQRVLLGVLSVVLVGVVSACDDSNPPPPVPTRIPSTPVDVSAADFTLRPDQMRGYIRAGEEALSPSIIATTEADPSLTATLADQGFRTGARATYGPPTQAPASTPFRQVVSTAIVFASSDGAARYATDELARRNQPPTAGGTTVPVAGFPAGVGDTVTALRTTAPASAAGGTLQGFLVIVRHGRVVAEVLAAGDPTTATQDAAGAVVTLQEALVAVDPSTGG